MAQVSIEVGQNAKSIPIPNAKLIAVTTLVCQATGGPVDGTAEEKIEHLLQYTKQHWREVANGQKRRNAITKAEAAVVPEDLEE